MDTDRNLLFGVLALQADLIDATQFIEACLLWTTSKNECLADLLLGRGWIEPADRAHVEYLLERRVQKHGGNAYASLATIPDDIKLSLAALGDDIERSLSGGTLAAEDQLATIDYVPAHAERYEKITWPGGREGWLSTNKMPFRDRDGTIIGTFGVSRDITQRKQAEIALRQSEERFRLVISAMQNGILLLDADGGIRVCNDSAERMLGLSADQLRGPTPLDPRWSAIGEDCSPFPDEARPPMVTLRTGQPCSNVIMGVQRHDGSLTWLSVNSQPLFHPDGTTLAGVVACFTDVTDRRRTEETLRQTSLDLTYLQQRLESGGIPCPGPVVQDR
jgi:PAS domain S-box-containing protein